MRCGSDHAGPPCRSPHASWRVRINDGSVMAQRLKATRATGAAGAQSLTANRTECTIVVKRYQTNIITTIKTTDRRRKAGDG